MNKIINISEATSIAIHSLALIARSEKLMNAVQISNSTNFSKNHISKVLQLLTKHNLLESERGPNGGFKLKADPAAICLLDIYELIEGKANPHQCGIHYETCQFSTCVYGDMIETFSTDIIEYLRKRTLKDIITTNTIKIT